MSCAVTPATATVSRVLALDRPAASPLVAVAERRPPRPPPARAGRGRTRAAAADRRGEQARSGRPRWSPPRTAGSIQVRAVTAVARAAPAAPNWTQPYRLDTGGGYTLVLTQRSADVHGRRPAASWRRRRSSARPTAPTCSPRTSTSTPGAKLRLANPGGLTLRLASSSNGFVSIVSFGGELTLEGTPQARTTHHQLGPAHRQAGHRRRRRPGLPAGDRRPVRHDVRRRVQHLGFWSGRTGGLSLTGTDRPNTGDVDGPDAPDQGRSGTRPRPSGSATPATAARAGNGGVLAQPSGPLATPDSRFTVPGLSYVSGKISTVDDHRQRVRAVRLQRQRHHDHRHHGARTAWSDGVVMHRFASSAVIERVDVPAATAATASCCPGPPSRCASATRPREDNGGNGFTLSGQPLADGPSASGESIGSYGSNSVSNSIARDNGHYGIEILGGLDVGVQNNQVEGSDMGIVARQGAQQGDHHRQPAQRPAPAGHRGPRRRHRGHASPATSSTAPTPASTCATRSPRSAATPSRTPATTASRSSARSAGRWSRTTSIAGVGPSALDTSRADGRSRSGRTRSFAWHDTSSFWVKFRHYASPMTMLWTAILLLIVFSAVKGRRRRRTTRRDPYADKTPLVTPGSTETPSRRRAAGRRRR